MVVLFVGGPEIFYFTKSSKVVVLLTLAQFGCAVCKCYFIELLPWPSFPFLQKCCTAIVAFSIFIIHIICKVLSHFTLPGFVLLGFTPITITSIHYYNLSKFVHSRFNYLWLAFCDFWLFVSRYSTIY